MLGLIEERGDLLCRRCSAVFRTARVLIGEGIEDESVIIPTLAFAAQIADGVPANFRHVISRRYLVMGLAFVKQEPVDGVLLLQQAPAAVEVERYEGSTLPKRICIRVFLRSAKPKRIVELYEETLRNEGIPTDGSGPGRLGWEHEGSHLTVIVDTGDELPPVAAAVLANVPQEQRPFFPLPGLVGKLYASLLGTMYKDKSWGFAYTLGGSQSGPPKSKKKALLACVAACVYNHPAESFPVEIRELTARLINRHVLAPCGETELPEGSSNERDNLLKTMSVIIC